MPSTACGGGAEDGQEASAATSPSVSIEVPASPTPVVTRAAEVGDLPDNRKGRRAFTHHVVATWGYALNTNDAKPLLRLSHRDQPCEGCRQFAAELRKRKKQGWYVAFPGAEVRRTTFEIVSGVTVAGMVVDIPVSDAYNRDGSYAPPTRPARGHGSRWR